MFKRSVALALFFLVVASPTFADLLDKVKSGSPLTVGFTNMAPWTYIDESGKLVGQEIEILEILLKKMGGGELQGTVIDFSALINGVISRRIDIAAAGIFIRPDRCKEVGFSEPLAQVPLAFIVQKGNPLNLNKYEDIIKNRDAILAATTGTTEAMLARKAGIPQHQVKLFDDTSDAIYAVRVGRADAAAELWVAAKYAEAHWPNDYNMEVALPIYELMGESVIGHTAFIVHSKEIKFLSALNAELKKFLDSPKYKEISEKYGFGPATIPSKTKQQLCSP